MSLWYSMGRSCQMNQYLGEGLITDDWSSSLSVPSTMRGMLCPEGHYMTRSNPSVTNDADSTIVANKDKFEVNLDVQHFAPEEITVKVSGKNTITVEGKHEEKQDEHGFVSRHFVRKCILPEGHDIDKIVSNLSSDGVLNITVPRVGQGDDDYRNIPIQQAGMPAKAVNEAKKQETGLSTIF